MTCVSVSTKQKDWLIHCVHEEYIIISVFSDWLVVSPEKLPINPFTADPVKALQDWAPERPNVKN